jgi:hypothetical protein
MSAGHPHRRPNARHAQEFLALRREPGVARRLALRFRVDTAHDVADLAGYDTTGRVVYLDRHLVDTCGRDASAWPASRRARSRPS